MITKPSGCILLVLLLAGLPGFTRAQDNPEEVPAFQRSILSRFDPELAPSGAQQDSLREAYLTEIRFRISLLDTLSLPERRKERLLKQLTAKPFSRGWEKVLSKVEFEDLEMYADPDQE